jgi:hypothetical protein
VLVPMAGIGMLGTVTPVLPQSVVDTIASTIQTQEGYYPGSLAYTNNNPGNLIYAGQAGATPGAGGFAAFPSYAAGQAALDNQIQIYATNGLTINQMMALYAPAGQGSNNPSAYAQTIADALGVSPDTTLTDIPALMASDSGDSSSDDSDSGEEIVALGMTGSELAIGAGILGLLALVAFR